MLNIEDEFGTYKHEILCPRYMFRVKMTPHDPKCHSGHRFFVVFPFISLLRIKCCDLPNITKYVSFSFWNAMYWMSMRNLYHSVNCSIVPTIHHYLKHFRYAINSHLERREQVVLSCLILLCICHINILSGIRMANGTLQTSKNVKLHLNVTSMFAFAAAQACSTRLKRYRTLWKMIF